MPPRELRFEHLEIAWQFLPCRRVGGDIFNIIPIGDESIGCYIMDASGHGVHSALAAVSILLLLHPATSSLALSSPSAVFQELDRPYPLERFNTFFSMIYMVLEFESGTFEWCNAGHPPAVLIRKDGSFELLHSGSHEFWN